MNTEILFNYIKTKDSNIIQIKTINKLDTDTFDMLNNNGYLVRYYSDSKFNEDIILVLNNFNNFHKK